MYVTFKIRLYKSGYLDPAFCSTVVNDRKNESMGQWILLMYSKFTPTCFGKWLPLQGAAGVLVVTPVLSVLWAYMDYDPSSVASCH
jgi:hypothetical protein